MRVFNACVRARSNERTESIGLLSSLRALHVLRHSCCCVVESVCGRVVKLVNTSDLKSAASACGFKSRHAHQWMALRSTDTFRRRSLRRDGSIVYARPRMATAYLKRAISPHCLSLIHISVA